MTYLFDPTLRALRRDRAARMGPEMFLFERAFADCLERIGMLNLVQGSALLLGCPDPGWKTRLQALGGRVDVLDPGPAFAARAGGKVVLEDKWPATSRYELIVAIGTLDTVNNLPLALYALGVALEPGGVLIGAMSGGETLPLLRSAMGAADRSIGAASPHIHPRIEPAALASLLQQAGLSQPVIDVDRISASYASIGQLVRDLRSMGATNILAERSRRYLGKRAVAAAEEDFAAAAENGRARETFEILHFAAWKPER